MTMMQEKWEIAYNNNLLYCSFEIQRCFVIRGSCYCIHNTPQKDIIYIYIITTFLCHGPLSFYIKPPPFFSHCKTCWTMSADYVCLKICLVFEWCHSKLIDSFIYLRLRMLKIDWQVGAMSNCEQLKRTNFNMRM